MSQFEIARESLGMLVSDVVDAPRFSRWKTSLAEGTHRLLSSYAVGEIFWRKSLGRPRSTRLSDAFTIQAWRDELVLVGDIGGAARWVMLPVPYSPSLWDGQDDADYWRVRYLIANLASGESADGLHPTYTHIIPHFADGIAWDTPGGLRALFTIGLKTFDPSGVSFVKPSEPVSFSFEVVRRAPSISP